MPRELPQHGDTVLHNYVFLNMLRLYHGVPSEFTFFLKTQCKYHESLCPCNHVCMHLSTQKYSLCAKTRGRNCESKTRKTDRVLGLMEFCGMNFFSVALFAMHLPKISQLRLLYARTIPFLHLCYGGHQSVSIGHHLFEQIPECPTPVNVVTIVVFIA